MCNVLKKYVLQKSNRGFEIWACKRSKKMRQKLNFLQKLPNLEDLIMISYTNKIFWVTLSIFFFYIQNFTNDCVHILQSVFGDSTQKESLPQKMHNIMIGVIVCMHFFLCIS